MIAGQVVDVENSSKVNLQEYVDFIEENKTGALICAPIIAGLSIAGADESIIDAFNVYARRIGKAFQISDDILDMTGSIEELGKTPGKDFQQEKANFAIVNGIVVSPVILTFPGFAVSITSAFPALIFFAYVTLYSVLPTVPL